MFPERLQEGSARSQNDLTTDSLLPKVLSGQHNLSNLSISEGIMPVTFKRCYMYGQCAACLQWQLTQSQSAIKGGVDHQTGPSRTLCRGAADTLLGIWS
jgi:hypothetical protein